MKKILSRNTILRVLPAAILASGFMASCNSKEKNEEIDYEPALSVAVKSFSLNPNTKIMANLDSVYFSIDLDHGVIFNADSLPVGTAINKLVPVIGYPSTVTAAEITMSGGSTREGTVNYIDSPSDSIDFTGNVTLTLKAGDELSRSYRIKVNVHKTVADSLMWDNIALSKLPSRSAAPKAQKSVSFGKKVVTLIEEADNSLTVATCDNPADMQWRKSALNLQFTPRLRSLAATDDALYILADDGSLYTSTDALTWSATGSTWLNIVGGFGKQILGISGTTANPQHDIYPRPASFTPTPVATDFPTEGYSNFNSFSSRWASDPIGFLTGGSRDGKTLSSSWAFDGSSWAKISNRPLPAMTDALIIPYFNYRKTTTSWIQTEFSVWLCFGGRLANGSINPDIYISYDNGVNWEKADSLLQLPSYIPASIAADAVIRTTPMNADLNAYWKSYSSASYPAGAKLQYFIDGSDVDWDCPYIYLFGGLDKSGKLNDSIWRAVLARLTYAPLF